MSRFLAECTIATANNASEKLNKNSHKRIHANEVRVRVRVLAQRIQSALNISRSHLNQMNTKSSGAQTLNTLINLFRIHREYICFVHRFWPLSLTANSLLCAQMFDFGFCAGRKSQIQLNVCASFICPNVLSCVQHTHTDTHSHSSRL